MLVFCYFFCKNMYKNLGFLQPLLTALGKSHSCRTDLHYVRTMRPIPKNINQLNNFVTVNILIYAAIFTEFFVQI